MDLTKAKVAKNSHYPKIPEQLIIFTGAFLFHVFHSSYVMALQFLIVDLPF